MPRRATTDSYTRRLGRVAAHIAEVAAAERVEVEAQVLARFEPVIFDAGLVKRVEHHAKALSLSTRRMPSGAGHDACWASKVAPATMVMCPCVGGLSHNEAEEISKDWAAAECRECERRSTAFQHGASIDVWLVHGSFLFQ